MSRYRRSRVEGGTYFFTVTLAEKKTYLLVDEIALLRAAYCKVQLAYPFQTVAICVLPNHLHAIWRLPAHDSNYSLRWSLIKRFFVRPLPINAKRSASKAARGEKGIWQRRFWEHQIRYEADLAQHIQYVHFNPVKHGLVRDVADWPFSSWHAHPYGRMPAV